MFNIIVPKSCQIFDKYLPFVQYYCAKTLSNLCQIFNKNLIQQLTQYNSGRMIYFRENSNVSSDASVKINFRVSALASMLTLTLTLGVNTAQIFSDQVVFQPVEMFFWRQEKILQQNFGALY